MKPLLLTSALILLTSGVASAQEFDCSGSVDDMTIEQFAYCEISHLTTQSLWSGKNCLTNCSGEPSPSGDITMIVTPAPSGGGRDVIAPSSDVALAPLDTVEPEVDLVPTEIVRPEVVRETAYAQPKKLVTKRRKSKVFFERGSAELRVESSDEILGASKILKSNPNLSMEIEGHASADGDEVYNLDLSKRRARAVYYSLLEDGVPASQIQYQGFGENRPVNWDNPYASENRRVEIRFVVGQ